MPICILFVCTFINKYPFYQTKTEFRGRRPLQFILAGEQMMYKVSEDSKIYSCQRKRLFIKANSNTWDIWSMNPITI